jgi:hypothetical protein
VEEKMRVIRGIIASAFRMLFDQKLFEPEEAGAVVAEVATEEGDCLFRIDGCTDPMDLKIADKSAKNFLRRFRTGFDRKISENIK